MYDSLTELYDRGQFFHLLHKLMEQSSEYGAPIGLLIIDIKRFRKINKIFGHSIGDEVLKSVSETLKGICREGDVLSRIGDDQFAVLLSRLANPGHAQLAALKIHRLLDLPVQTSNNAIKVSAVIGIGIYPNNANSADELLVSAEKALYQAKAQQEKVGYLQESDRTEISDDWEMEFALAQAISNSEFEIYFQPKVSLLTGEPVGAEALLRWNHPTQGQISPGIFLPIAESIDYMKPLTLWVLNSTLRLSSEWTRIWKKLSVSVNVPPSMLKQADFVDLILSAERLWPRDNVNLCLEIVEESLVDNVEEAFNKLNLLRENGITISIDDFGTGYSSLSYFRDLPTDELKIDQSFIRGMKTDKANIHIVNLIIAIAHRFGLQVVAEGVESKDILDYLKKRGCDIVQGYYVAKPMPYDQFSTWLEQHDPKRFVELNALSN